MATTHTCDLAIVGAGLAGGLIALAVQARHPALDVRLIDSAPVIGGDHRWSFFADDIAPADRWIVAPLVTQSWAAHDVAFPDLARRIAAPYFSIASERLDAVVRAALPEGALMLGRAVGDVTPNHVAFADGTGLAAGGVIDARGPGDLATLDLGWQKFVGRELRLAAPHDAPDPRIMDATVAQIDGYRFVYCLPLGPRRMFVEDTYYSDTPELDRPALADRIHDYAATRGWQVEQAAGEEHGVLPVVLGGDFARYWRSTGTVAKAGMRAGLFHPTTGYSLPDAVRTAAMIAGGRDFDGVGLHARTHDLAAGTWRRRGFYRMLDTMLFRAASPTERYRVLERFYRLSPGLIGRFYAGESTMRDKARVLLGKPPVPIGRAVRALRGGTA
ncbi:lycopene beta-cyclase CrtY [Sphingomonas sp. KR1UV-12]|uniref:Lycopene beta-cyclase CrtY n=1 Tax=Sphingomonas aurea TaxID=3063994 RepID=A0ABT9ENW6_9SPHN|nr:lycopene beta-cyclase CrtY [Sphingomonas sp. KR1UV-12]MDP1028660.1 lycopene beta-cyclase CrtY [Sphingomonas sp. KR1UV-12]